MPMPSSPKEAKPKTENIAKDGKSSGAGFDATKLLIINAVTSVIICVLFIGVNYFVQTNFMNAKFAALMSSIGGGEAEEEEAEADAVERGLILDLGDFVLNLSDTTARRYLKANVAIELTKKASDPDPTAAPAEGEGGGHGGHGGGEGGGADAGMKAIEAEMDQFKPSIRDAVISTLSSKTSDELSSIAGKEEAKEQIKEAVNAIFAGDREVLRVSFGNFIIQ
ncbi:MAG: flagellar basal body-associated FliL family protein [Candidatus Gastranaerophilales bacterium]|jgi:flagellar basal body-associated protein FliL|nr:flagellar basal body-associated FliL family protein [Candidatus Gastranaerophilales bacterium]